MQKIQVALVGQPNVGKSSLFSRLTGVGVISSNYPGTTVEFEEATINVNDLELHCHDLPGTYSLTVNSDDEKVVLDMLRDKENDVVVVVADGTNIEPSLVLTLEILELGVPTVVALNKIDAASKRYDFDLVKLQKILGVPVIPVSSKTGSGVKELLDAIVEKRASVSDFITLFDDHIEENIRILMDRYPGLTKGHAVKCLEGISLDNIVDKRDIEEMNDAFSKIHRDSMQVHIARDRYGEAHAIAIETMKRSTENPSKREKLSDMTINPSTGIPILIGVIVVTFAVLIIVGGLIAEGIDLAYATLGISNGLIDFGRMIGGDFGAAIMTGIDSSIQAILGLVIPYIMVFYIMLGVLEDSGYLPRAVVLLDKTMHRFGLHGSGFIPMMVGLGCNVPAILATRTVRSKREKIILCSMICMAVPCSAQLATMAGVTSNYGGVAWFIGIMLILVTLGVIVGIILNRTLKYEPSNLIIELPELQMPSVRNVISKMWMRSADFFKLAVPLLVIGTIIVEILIYYNALDPIVEPMAWLTRDLLGLPPTVIICFIVGIVRKEMSFAMLSVVGAMDIMTANPQMFIVYGVVMSIYLPCLATLAVMGREIGKKNTVIVSIVSIVVAFAIGAFINLMFKTF